MPKTKISEYSATANSNTDVASINIDEGCAPSGINNAIRAVMGHLKDFQQGTNGDPFNGPVNGTLGATTPSTGAFTTVSATGNATIGNATAGTNRYLNINGVANKAGGIGFQESGVNKWLIGNGAASENGNFEIYDTTNGNNFIFTRTGNLGLGVTPSAWVAGYTALQVGNSSWYTTTTGQIQIASNTYQSASFIDRYLVSSFAAKYEQLSGAHRWFTAPSGTAGNAITFTQAMTLDASGNLLVGGTSNSAGARLLSENASGNQLGLRYTSVATWYNSIDSSGNYIWTKDGTNIARFDSSGNLLVGTTSVNSVGVISVDFLGQTKQGITLDDTWASTGGVYILFRNSAGDVAGRIDHNGTTTVAYTTSSDYRLKENIASMTGALAKVLQLNPVTYKWKSDGTDGQGFIAHELQAIVPDAVVGAKDAMNEDGSINPQGIDTSFLVATLTAAIQEQQALITQLTARITALESA